ncbi:hypothetical protein [Methylobacterium sp. Leaf118]|uniref:hypothetical protein n=1 Tax=Methylobacterium sp. Leaf118 TaxID=2876562 RepID=UPI001E3B73BA|nr:hypothetical protein [Methylobacterium sp. Leaf118]
MPTVGVYRGVGIHDFQPAERVERMVKPAIEAVFALYGGWALLAYASDPAHPPEARLLAAARIEAIWQLAIENREVRPEVHPDKARVATGSLDSLHWACPRRYGSLLEPGPAPGEHRPARDRGSQEALERAQAAWTAQDRQRRLAGVWKPLEASPGSRAVLHEAFVLKCIMHLG